MKKIIFPLLALSFMALSCNDADRGYDTKEEPAFAITSADVHYNASGGMGKITASEAVSAEAEDQEWCHVSVSGKIVNIAVDPNGSLQSRETTLKITKGGYTRRLGIFQNGTVFYVAGEQGSLSEGTPEVIGYKVGSTVEIPFIAQGNLNVSVVQTPSWATAEWGEGKLTVTATEIGTWINPRSGTVKLSVNGALKNIVVTQAERQLEYDSFIGTYNMTYYTPSSTLPLVQGTIENVRIEADVAGESFLIKGVGSGARYTIPAQYEEGSIKFYVGTLVGQYTTGGVPYDVKVRLVTDTGSSGTTTSYYVYSTYNIVNDKLVLKLNVNKGTSSTAYTGFGFYYLYTPTSTTYNQGRYAQEVLLYQQ